MRESTVLARRFRDSPQQGRRSSIFFPQVFAEVLVRTGGGATEIGRPRVESVHQEVPLQVINRTAGTGQAAVKFHGLVTCIRIFNADQDTPDPSDDERYVRFGGFQTVKGKQTANAFTVDTQDNGEGMNALEADQILFRQRGDIDEPCDDDEITSELRSPTLARGNVQEHKQSSNTSSTRSRPSSAKSTSTRLSVLR